MPAKRGVSNRVISRIVVYGLLALAVAVTILSVRGGKLKLAYGEAVPWFDGCFADLQKTVEQACDKVERRKPVLKEMILIRLRTRQLAELATHVDSELRETEKRLAGFGLSDECLNKHRTFAHDFEGDMSKLASMTQSLTGHYLRSFVRRRQAQATRYELRTLLRFLEEREPREAGILLDVNSLPHRSAPVREPRVAEMGETRRPEQKEAWVPPSAGQYLEETMEVKFTEEIRELAASLGHSPLRICEYLRTNLDYEPYYGSLKGARETLLEEGGNDLDLASLLIALLRASGIPARYVHGEIIVSAKEAAGWLGGVDDAATAGRILATSGVPSVYLMQEDSIVGIRVEHCWVEAFLGEGRHLGRKHSAMRGWVTLDPSYKQYVYCGPKDIPQCLPFDEVGYLRRSQRSAGFPEQVFTKFMSSLLDAYVTSPLDFYLEQMEDTFKVEHPDEPFIRIAGGGELRDNADSVLHLSLPYESWQIFSRYSEIPDSMKHMVTLQVTDLSGGIQLSHRLSTAEVVGLPILLHYVPSTAKDESTIRKCGGLYDTPAYLIEVKPELRVGGMVVGTGRSVGFGESQLLRIDFIYPSKANMDSVVSEVVAGEWRGVTFGLQTIPNEILTNVADTLTPMLEEIVASVPDSAVLPPQPFWVEQLFSEMGLWYLSQIDLGDRLLGFFLHVVNTREPSVAMVGYGVTVANLFGRPYSVKLGSTSVDAKRILNRPFSVTGDDAARRTYNLVSGYESSYLMHSTLELFGTGDCISAVKILQTAYRHGIPIQLLDSTNINRVVSSLEIPSDVKKTVRDAVGSGKVVRIPKRELTVGEWRGGGYIVTDPATGDGAYKLYGTYQKVYVPATRMLLVGVYVAVLVVAAAAVVWAWWFGSGHGRRNQRRGQV